MVLEALCSGARFSFHRYRCLVLSHVVNSPLPAPSPYAEQIDSFTERREPESRPTLPVCAVHTGPRVPRLRTPPVPGTHVMALRPSSVPLRVPLPPPPESSLPAVLDPESDLACPARPTVPRLLATVVTDPSFESTAASALVAELVDFAAACRLDYATALVAESESACPLSIRGECALATDVLEERQEDFEYLAAAVLQRFGFRYSSPQSTPLPTGHLLSAPPLDESVERSGPYPELVGCLMYLMTCTRPDLAYPLSILARYVAPGRHRREHWEATKRVLRYLCSTSGMGLVLVGRDPVVLTQHANASWVDDLATLRSSHGYTFSLGSGCVSWWSTRLSSVLSSSCEAEIYAGAMADQELHWLTYLLTDLGEWPHSPPVLYQCGQLRLAYVATRANTADIFTKALHSAMASLRVLAFDHEGRLVQFDAWLDDLQLYLLSDSKDSVSLFDLVSGAATAPPATADSSTRSQWLTRDAAARLAIRNHLPLTECAHFGQHRIAQALYDAVVARYSSPATAALGRLLLPYLFPELSAFTTVEDLVSHLRASDAHYRAAVPAEFLDRNPPAMYITLYFIVTRLPDSLRSVRDHFLSLDPTSLTVDLLEQHLLAVETSEVAVGAARGTPCLPFLEGCSPSPLAPSYASAAAVDVFFPEDVGAASASVKRRSSKGKGGGGGSGSGSGGSSGGGGGGGTVGGSGGSGGSGGGSSGSGGSGGGGTGSGGTGARRVGLAGGQRQQQQHRSETPSPQQLREWFLRGASGGSCPYVIRTGDRAGQTCGRLHTVRD
ncbi:unnamed protein product [Closterium sp. NIES-53]